jgi:hypothetical protein
MSSRPIWPQPPSPLQKTPLHAVPTYPVGNLSRPSYIEQLRQVSTAQAAPYVELLKAASPPDEPPLPSDVPLRDALIALLANTLATGREYISGQEIFWRLRVPHQKQKRDGRDIARVLRSLGWVRSHYGKDGGGGRVWGWKWREWNVSAALSLETPENTPLPVVRPHRPPISIFYGDDVPVYEATPEGIWQVIRYPLGPRLKLGKPWLRKHPV